MPVVPQPNAQGVVRSLGFAFDFTEAVENNSVVSANTQNIATVAQSLGENTDIFPTQQTAWGRANMASDAISRAYTVLSSTLTWSGGDANTTSTAVISDASFRTTSIIHATIVGGTIDDAIRCWIISTVVGEGSLTINLAGNPTVSPNINDLVFSIVNLLPK
jgi:hypothetical protein